MFSLGPQFLENTFFREIDLLPGIFALDHIDLVQLAVFDKDTSQNAGFISYLEPDPKETSPMFSIFRVDPPEGLNQSIILKMENISSLMLHFQSEITLTVVVADAKRSRGGLLVVEDRTTAIMTDKGESIIGVCGRNFIFQYVN